MVLWRRKEPGLATSVAQPGFLADDTWAAPAIPGSVPASCLGLCVTPEGTVVAVALPGTTLEAVRSPPTVRYWWVRTDPWCLTMVPHPTLAPEAGLALQLAPLLANGAGSDLLAALLARCSQALDRSWWDRTLRSCECLGRLPPCAPPDLLEEVALEVQQWLTSTGLPVGVQRIERVDLPAPHALCEPPAESPADSAHFPPQPLPEPTDDVPHTMAWTPLLEQDTRLWALLQQRLPRLEPTLAAHWAGGGWDDGGALYPLQAQLSQTLGLMAAKLGRAPALERSGPGRGAEPPRLAQRLVATALVRAVRHLAELDRLIEKLPRATPPDAATLQALVDETALLQESLDVRLNAWRELSHAH